MGISLEPDWNVTMSWKMTTEIRNTEELSLPLPFRTQPYVDGTRTENAACDQQLHLLWVLDAAGISAQLVTESRRSAPHCRNVQ